MKAYSRSCHRGTSGRRDGTGVAQLASVRSVDVTQMVRVADRCQVIPICLRQNRSGGKPTSVQCIGDALRGQWVEGQGSIADCKPVGAGGKVEFGTGGGGAAGLPKLNVAVFGAKGTQ